MVSAWTLSYLYMDDIVNQSAVEHLLKVFALATALVMFWILEAVWRTDRRWLIPIAIFPLSIFLFVVAHWEDNRAKCFFGALLFVIMLLVGGLVGHSFFEQVIYAIKLVAFWPYYLYQYFNKPIVIAGYPY